MEKDLFVEVFFEALDSQGKDCSQEVKKLKKAIKDNKDEFIGMFSLDGKDYSSLISAMQEKDFHEKVAQEMVVRFKVEENFRENMVLIVRGALLNYQDVFLGTISVKQALQLILLLQGQKLDKILQSLNELEKTAAAPVKKAIEQAAAPDGETIAPKWDKQIKILSITASPGDDLRYEREQDTMLDAFRDFDRERVFLDMPDPVKDTLTGIEEHLQDGKHDILHITAHGSINEKGEGVLSFETEEGEEALVTGSELAKALNPRPKILILCSCRSASEEPGLLPAAKALREAGVESVIGMKKAISHEAAMEFNRAFLLSLSAQNTLKQAFEAGKEAVFKGEEERQRQSPGREALKEYEIPQLLTADENLTAAAFSDYRIAAPGRPRSHRFMGAQYLERGFIGRRQILRRVYRSIKKGLGAIVLKGPGGIGKSTLTTRAAANLNRQGYEFIVVQGETGVAQILQALSQKAAAKDVPDAEKIFSANAGEKDKLVWYLENYLLKNKVLIIFDNFEENQDGERDWDFRKPGLAEFLGFFRDSLQHSESFLFFSTRYTLPGFDHPDVCEDITEFSPVEYRKMLLNRDALKNADKESIEKLRREIGGNPRALELLDKIAYKEFGSREFSWQELEELIPGLRKRIIEKRGKGDDFTPLFLDRLLKYLTPEQRGILDAFSIFRIPVPKGALTVFDLDLPREDRVRLQDFSLLERTPGDDADKYYIHRLTAQHLQAALDEAARAAYHQKAAGYFAALRDDEGVAYLEGKKFLDNDIEARWHYLRAGLWDDAAAITFDLEAYLELRGYPQRALELLLELPLPKLNEENQAIFHNRTGILYQGFGEYDKALTSFEEALKIDKRRKDDNGTAANLHQIGIIHQLKGHYDEALKNYEQSLEIAGKLGNPKGIAESLHQIGMIHEEKGRYDEALSRYQQSLEIREKIGDTKGIAESLGQIGIIYQKKGQYDEALKNYEKCRKIFSGLGAQKELSTTLHQIGMIYEEKGQYDEALKHYRQSLEIKEKIGDTKGIAESLHQIGIIYQKKGRYDEALKSYQQALEIAEKIGDIAGSAISLGQMGNLYFEQKEYETALRNFIQAFITFDKIGSPNAKLVERNIARVREKMAPEQFEKILKEFGSSEEGD